MRIALPNKSSVLAGVLLVLAVSAAARGLTLLKVAATADDEAYPSVSGNVVVWQVYNSRYDDWDIRGAVISNGAAGASFTICDFPNDDQFPVIDGNDVVWQHQYSQDGDGDVYAARIANGRTESWFAISNSPDNEVLPCVAGGVVAWQHMFSDAADWDILGARLTGRENPQAFFISAGIDVDELFPALSGNLVVWQQRSADLPEPFAYGADIREPNKPRVFYTTMALGEHEIPALSDGWLVGRETDGAGKVMVDNLFDPFNPEGISGSTRTACPKIHKHIVVWQDQGGNNTWDIRGYNLITRQEFGVTDMKMSEQVNPSVYVDSAAKRAIIVWQDNRDGNWDIYAAILDGPEVAATNE